MKKTILTLATICAGIFIGGATAQSVNIYYPNGHAADGDTIEFPIAVDSSNLYQEFVKDDFVTIVNTSNDTNTYKVRRIEHNVISGTKDYLCWGGTCFGAMDAGVDSIWVPNDSITLSPGDTAGTQPGMFGLKIYFQPKGKIGEVLYEYQIFNTNDPLGFDKTSIFIKYPLDYLTSIDKKKAIAYNFIVYPNPVSDVANINIDLKAKSGEFTLIVKDILGQEITKESVQAGVNKMQLDMSGYSKGIYFVSLMNQQEVLKTKKLIVK